MAQTFPNMGLVGWTQGDDPYRHQELANNFSAIDAHDHSASRGLQIPTDGIKNYAVTKIKLAQPSVDTENIYPGAITFDMLDPALFNVLIPMGVVFPYLKLHSSQTIPQGTGYLFEIPQGQTLTADKHDLGNFSLTLPNLIGTFPYWGVASGATGGANVKDFTHQHPVGSHVHGMSHAHGVSAHSHALVMDGYHRHRWDSNYNGYPPQNLPFPAGRAWNDLASRDYVTSITGHGGELTINKDQAVYIPQGFNEDQTDPEPIPMEYMGGHNHNGGTQPQTATTDNGNKSQTDAPSGSTNTGSAGGASVDIRPSYHTMIPLVRVRNTV